MWEVVGFNVRNTVCKDGITRRYYDIYVQREASGTKQGLEVAAADYREDRFAYVPKIGDRIFVAFGRSEHGRVYIADLQQVS